MTTALEWQLQPTWLEPVLCLAQQSGRSLKGLLDKRVRVWLPQEFPRILKELWVSWSEDSHALTLTATCSIDHLLDSI